MVPEMTSSDFDEMAKNREEEAAKLSDFDIWKSVVKKAVKLDVETNVRADILLQSIPDIGVIFSQLKSQFDKGNLTSQDYHDLLEVLIEKVETEMKEIEFDPVKYRDEST